MTVDNLQKAGALLARSEEHTSELQSRFDLVCRLLLEKKKKEIVEVDCIAEDTVPEDGRDHREKLEANDRVGIDVSDVLVGDGEQTVPVSSHSTYVELT